MTLKTIGSILRVLRRPLGVAAVLVFLATAAWINFHLAHAAGAPAMKPLSYAGTIEEGGQLVDGVRDVTARVWRDAASNDGAALACTTIATAVPVTRGRFRILLDDTCTAPVHENPDLWVEIVVANVSVGRRKIAAVPYALEASHAATASSATGPLSGQIVPSGMIAMFNGPCPAGWTEDVALRGRFPRGEPLGNPAALEVGGSDDAFVVAHTHMATALIQPAGDHAHTVSGTTSSDGDHSHVLHPNSGFGAGTLGAGFGRVDLNSPGTVWPLHEDPAGAHVHTVSGTAATAGSHSHTGTVTVAAAGGAGTGATLPRYQEVIFCIKG